MKYSVEDYITLSEKAQSVRVETEALLTAVKFVIGKKMVSEDTSHIPEKWKVQYLRQVEEKILIIKRQKKDWPFIA